MNNRIEYTKNEYAAETVLAYLGDSPGMFVRSYGCQQNVNDGERLKGVLLDIGFKEVDSPEKAKLIILNTCAVREHAEQRVLGNIGALKALKDGTPNVILALCGCMGEKKDTVAKIKKSYPHVDIVFGTNSADTFPDALAEKLSGSKRIFHENGVRHEIVENLPLKRESGFKAFLPIMYGCNNFCSYCIVPYVRGRERSRTPQDIMAEFGRILDAGYKEITLLGQNVNSYGENLDVKIDFSDLLALLCETGLACKIRFMTSHPKDASKKLIDTMAKYPQICKHIHLPVQSGSNEILKQMNRGYTIEKYMELINYAKEKCPEITFSSDVIVGFPGETQSQFEQTAKLIECVGYTQLFTFIFSKRSGTPAALLEDNTLHMKKAENLNKLLKIQEGQVAIHAKNWLGKVYIGLIEGTGRRKGTLAARLDNNMLVEFPENGQQSGDFVKLFITDLKGAILLGRAV